MEREGGIHYGSHHQKDRSVAGTDIHVVMAYRFPGQESKAAIELYPVTGRRSVTAAKEAGFSASAVPALLVESDSLDFLVAQVVGREIFSGFGFESDADAAKATPTNRTKKGLVNVQGETKAKVVLPGVRVVPAPQR